MMKTSEAYTARQRRRAEIDAEIRRDQLAKQPLKFAIGDIVFPAEHVVCMWGWYGKIVSIGSFYRNLAHRYEHHLAIRRYNSETGRIQLCPDSRCAGHKDETVVGCVICGRNHWQDELVKITPHDLRFYIQEGMICDVKEETRQTES